MEESDFHRLVDGVLSDLEHRLDAVDADIDTELSGGILTLTFERGTKIIINRQTPNREIWVAAKSGGYHFKFNGEQWLDTRSQQPLWSLLSAVIGEQAGIEIQLL
ncbi:MAG: iron donor protein CyaY [Betaproteobacteria bacterium]|nr:iron donor protein CyaY [Betaproteobacteria bacterium]